jgi:hypothetical protein
MVCKKMKHRTLLFLADSNNLLIFNVLKHDICRCSFKTFSPTFARVQKSGLLSAILPALNQHNTSTLFSAAIRFTFF